MENLEYFEFKHSIEWYKPVNKGCICTEPLISDQRSYLIFLNVKIGGFLWRIKNQKYHFYRKTMKGHLQHHFRISCIDYCKLIDQKHEIVDTTFVY